MQKSFFRIILVSFSAVFFLLSRPMDASNSSRLWTSACAGSCPSPINTCNELPYYCITASVCERCIKNQAGGCYACSVALSNLAQSYVEQGPQTYKVPEMVGLCKIPTVSPLCRYACRYKSWNEGQCDANQDCICRMDTGSSSQHTFGHLSSDLSSKLVDLLGFPKTDTWTQIYQAKIHGFTASNFHSRCDGRSKTVVVIQSTNGNIFGGYTDVPWGTGSVFRTDGNTHIFSLVNSLGRSVKFPIKNSEVGNSVYLHSSYGPTFGFWDLRIESNANANTNSISELGTTFNTSGVLESGTTEAHSFLAGSRNFQVLDVVVYQRVPSDTYFASRQMVEDIVDLVELPKADSWSVIYRGIVHGFTSSQFHSACDGRFKTLVVIQSANNWIFGGYTDVGWGTGSTFKSDPNAFLFSLTNPSYRPAKFPIKSGFSNALYWHSSYGPIFGNWDLQIFSNSHLDGSNFETVGFSYNTSGSGLFANADGEGFMTGARNFVVSDIIVYQRIQSNNYFLSSQMYTDLVALTGLPNTASWNMLYRGSVNGFSSSTFHSLCDGKLRALVLVESTNHFIFGGYTEVGWGTGNVFKSDAKAFIYSLKNSQNKPAIFPVKSSLANRAVYWHSSYGPIFGNDDLVISSSANGNANSFSTLGSAYNTASVFDISYNDAPSFLAGTSSFQINDIVVFQIN